MKIKFYYLSTRVNKKKLVIQFLYNCIQDVKTFSDINYIKYPFCSSLEEIFTIVFYFCYHYYFMITIQLNNTNNNIILTMVCIEV